MRINIFFIIPSLHGGGSERFVTHLVKNLNAVKFNITLVLVRKEGVFLSEIPSHVRILDLNLSRTRYAPFKVIKLIWRHKPDIVFSTLGHLNLVIAGIRHVLPKSTKFIARESSTVSVHNKNEVYPALFDFLFRTVYRSFDKIVCQSRYMQHDLLKNYNIPVEKTIVINNPIDEDYIRFKAGMASTPFPADKINFVAVGRLSKEKGFDRLIESFKIIRDKSIHLNIIGDGVDKVKLQQYVAAAGLGESISFLGFQSNPYPYMESAKALIQTSYYEGFPNVIIEANACGTPVIGFKSPGGIAEIVDNIKSGWLIEDGNLAELANKIQEVAYIKFDPESAKSYTSARFSLKKIIGEYEQLFISILNRKA
ncbi:glycosyltransferase [Pontibacter sp. FD36]|uniref:glycosyltransferase n=1 Tax=Pontibacter sp. FD36 TaxID=2789860 RepID=UPI0018AB83A1|nr:glycosyltransferase [Pontibacter sp. FD36]MBF8964583.1 glycosyltransferase [Pontibacter sp. FD36]